jgi:cell division protease FtsH
LACSIPAISTPGSRCSTQIPQGASRPVKGTESFAAPERDRFNYRKAEVQAKINVALGGRAAEEIVYGDTSTGAESDIQQLTEIARQMVGRWGMSAAVGPVAVIPRDGMGPLLPGAAEVSPVTQQLVDEEVRRIVEESHHEVVALLQENRGRLDSLATALLEHETLDEEDAYEAAGVPRTATASADSYSAAARSAIDS